MTGTRDSSDLTAMEAKSKASDGVKSRSAPQERDEQSSRQTFAQVSSENEALQTNQISIDENSEGEDDRKVKLRVMIGNKHITSSDEDDSVINNDLGDDSSKSLSYHENESFESSISGVDECSDESSGSEDEDNSEFSDDSEGPPSRKKSSQHFIGKRQSRTDSIVARQSPNKRITCSTRVDDHIDEGKHEPNGNTCRSTRGHQPCQYLHQRYDLA
jgi:hypothetical protein